MNSVKPRRMIRTTAASVALLSLFSLGMADMASAATGTVPAAATTTISVPATAATGPVSTVLSIQTALAPNPSTDWYNSRVLALINEKRAAVGSGPVKWNQSIGNVSQDWAEHLGRATMDPNFDWNTIHRSDAGGSLIPSGATWYRENIAFASTPESIVNWWMGSPGHKAAMLDAKATDIGIGYVKPTSGPYAGWTQVVTNLAAYPNSTPAPAPSTTIAVGTKYKTTIQLNLRSGGGFEYPVIGSGVTGTIVTATGRTNGIWYEVLMGSQTGWMSSEYLTKYADPTPAPVVKTPIAIKAAQINGGLGAATGPEVTGLRNGGAYQNYQHGAIIYSPATGARISYGAIRNTWAATGYENGGLGYPTTDEIGGLRNGGVYQNYENGSIIWSPTTGAQISYGAIRNKWAETGYENGGLGYPVTGEIGGLKNGGVFQNYQGGSIIWSPTTGAHISVGGIRSVWAASGYENGGLGYPVTDEIGGLKNGGVFQNYQGGAIIWSPATGGFISTGGIRSIWASTGYEGGRLGYPTSNEYLTGPNQVAQNYQGGTIHWTPTSSWIAWK